MWSWYLELKAELDKRFIQKPVVPPKPKVILQRPVEEINALEHMLAMLRFVASSYPSFTILYFMLLLVVWNSFSDGYMYLLTYKSFSKIYNFFHFTFILAGKRMQNWRNQFQNNKMWSWVWGEIFLELQLACLTSLGKWASPKNERWSRTGNFWAAVRVSC